MRFLRPIDLDYMVAFEIQLFTSVSGSTTFPRALRMMKNGQINALPLLGPAYPFERAVEAIQDVANKQAPGVKIQVIHEDVVD